MRKGTMTAASRSDSGSGVSRRIRRSGIVPAVVYGAGKAPATVTVSEDDIVTALRTGVRLLELSVDGAAQQVLLRDVQFDHLGDRPIHVDFQRLVAGHKLHIRVPVVYRGTPTGIKDGGVFNIVHDGIEIQCKPEDVPEEIVFDVTHLELGSSVHIRDLKLPSGVEALESADEVVAVVTFGEREEVAAPVAAPEEGSATTPEVIGEAARKAAADAKAPAGGAGGAGAKKDKK
jgi:large subunit ribosomal protein L25